MKVGFISFRSSNVKIRVFFEEEIEVDEKTQYFIFYKDIEGKRKILIPVSDISYIEYWEIERNISI